ncbi:MAG: hypothetical protein M3P91_04990 [Actinomycetota bacterium]|nr:hypothetical protein [Actinomycetota bacterium]
MENSKPPTPPLPDIPLASLAWPVPQGPRTGVYVSRPLWSGREPLRHVLHDADGDWQFLCGTTVSPQDVLVVPLEEVLARYPQAAGLHDLPVGTAASYDEATRQWQLAAARTD